WALHLKNVTVSLSGQYECSFATYPYGTKAAKIQLIVKAEGNWSAKNIYGVVSCLHILHGLLFSQGENGKKEELVTKEPSCPAVYRNGSALYRQRVRLSLNNTLKIFPTDITDDGRVFSCHVVYHPERVQKSSTTVRVFGK
ncbi:TACT protein, partial [Corythaixoides concolor]|nr:TACT protein [Corythaixoides concolor]